MVFSVSPSVNVREVDLTTSIPAITTPPAAIAGVFRWGPVNERILISSEIELTNVFGTPTDFNAETYFTAADFLSYSNALFVTRVVDANAAIAFASINSDEVFQSKYPGALANGIEIAYIVTDNDAVDPQFDEEVFSIGSTFDISFRETTLEVQTSDELGDIDVKIGDVLRLSTETSAQDLEVLAITLTNTEVVANTEIFTYEFEFKQRYNLTDGPTKVTRRWAYAALTEEAPAAGNITIIVIDGTGEITGNIGQILEKFENLSTKAGTKAPDGTNRYYRDFITERSNFIRPGQDDIGDPVDGIFVSDRQYLTLAGGADSSNENDIAFGVVAQGYDLYKEANDVDVSFILQGKANSSNLANFLIANIAEHRRDCVVFVSPTREDVVDVATEQQKLTNLLNYRAELQNSSYSFIDSGYKLRYDKYNDVFRFVPLNGDMAGLASLVEPFESPAGFRKGRVRNVIKLAFNPNKAQRDQLYGKDINPVITQVGQGTILFGDKTGLGTNTGSAFSRLNVRRLFITVEKAIATVSAQFLFEFNDEFTQNQFRQIVDPFLRDIQGRRGIIDFRVISDATVNTPQVIDANTFRANIFIKPARAINFIELTFVATRTGVEFEEIVGQQF